MTIAKNATPRFSVALTKETSEKIKLFATNNGLKMYEVIESLIDVANDNKEFTTAVIKLTESRSKERDANREIFSKKLAKLPAETVNKLKALSSDDLAALLEKAGL